MYPSVRNDAALVGERALTLGRSATEGGHKPPGVKRHSHPFFRDPRNIPQAAPYVPWRPPTFHTGTAAADD
jgi:hypothetical protein